MTTAPLARPMEAEDLARAREMVQMILRGWGFMTWDQLLSDEIVLTLRLGAIEFSQITNSVAIDGSRQFFGRADVKSVLKDIYPALRDSLSVTTELISGYDVVLLGKWSVPSTKENAEASSLPVALYLGFDNEGKVEAMTIAAVDLQSMSQSIRAAALNGAG